MKKILYRSLGIFVTVIILILFLLPGIVRRYAVNNSIELLGRQIQIDKLKLNCFTGTVKVFDFKIMEQDGKTVFSSFDTLIVNIEPYQYFKDKFVLEQFYLQGLSLNITKKDSLFNFDDLIAFHSTENDTIVQDTVKTKQFQFSLSNMELKDANFTLNDKTVDKITSIEDLSFQIPFIGWNQENKSEAGIKFNLKKGGYIESSINVHPINGDFDAKLTIHKLYLDPFYKYLTTYAAINTFNGTFNSELNIHGNINEIDKLLISGTTEINNFSMKDNQDKKFIAAEKIKANLNEIDVNNSSFIIDSLNLTKPYIYFKLDSTSNNFSRIFNEVESSSNQKETINKEQKLDSTTENSLYYAINHFNIHEGITDYTDNLTGSPFNYYLSNIEIHTDSILSDANWVDIHSTMLLNNRGTLRAELGINPSNPYYTNLAISVEKFLLSDINIYSNYYTGHTILEGDMYYNSNSIITNGKIESENKLLIKNVSLNNTKGGLYSLPLKFALFLIKDKNGDVNLDIPVRGDLNDPTINVGKIVWTTFKNLIVKVVTSPGRLLAGLVNGDPKDLEKITFTYLDTIPSDKNYKQLNMLLELEQKKKDLKIELVYYVDSKLQKEAIARSEVGKMYFTETQKNYLKDTKGFESYLLRKTVSDSLDLKKAIMSIANPTRIDSIANYNSKLLISNVTQYVKMGQDSTQINIIRSNFNAPENTGVSPHFKINYSMKDDIK